jgi:hypothetical protein
MGVTGEVTLERIGRLGAEDLGVVDDDPGYGGRSRLFLLRPEHVA